MSTSFTITTKTRVDVLRDNVSVGDVVDYDIDCTPWQADNATITSATWALESGNAAIASSTLVAGVASALVTFSEVGRVLISILLATATGQKKKIWLEVRARKPDVYVDDYGMTA